jgi:hypothetical protein
MEVGIVNVCDVQMMPNRTSVGEKQVNVSPTKCGVFWQVWKLVMRGKAEAVASNNKLKGDEESRVSFQMLVGGLRESNRLSSGFFFGSRHGNFFYCASTKRKRLGCRRQGFAVRLRSLFDDRRGRVRARVRGRKVNVFQFSLPGREIKSTPLLNSPERNGPLSADGAIKQTSEGRVMHLHFG